MDLDRLRNRRRFNGVRRLPTGEISVRQKLGIRQTQMLKDMIHFGGGFWPVDWKMSSTQKQIMLSLQEHGLVEPAVVWRDSEPHHTFRVVMEGDGQ